jgi:hypothetical protein
MDVYYDLALSFETSIERRAYISTVYIACSGASIRRSTERTSEPTGILIIGGHSLQYE